MTQGTTATRHEAQDACATVDVLGVLILDITLDKAVSRIEELIHQTEPRSRSVFFVNAHTLNVAMDDPSYLACLRTADIAFGDGSGVRYAARMRGHRLVDNVNGTDLVPALFDATAGRGYRYYLLGAKEDAIERAARHTQERFSGWTLAGYRHGYVAPHESDSVVAAINEAQPHLLLVGMGNPLQERWISEHQDRLRVPVCMAVGGLFDYWAGSIRRAPRWVRRLGIEWMALLLQQPHKARRYLAGNPKFMLRAVRWAARSAKR